ncbi:MAG: beta-ketoacyl-ACP synthase III [Proteobacteria bacterium]|nr:beta-ketoacyl-ACP synthase III [Pseudomonadota bacterium]
MQKAYITSTGVFLPGEPILNSQIENYIGLVNGEKSRHGRLILRQNGIISRHYALDESGSHIYSNADMAAQAIRNVVAESELSEAEIDSLAVSTTQGDMLVPGFGSTVHNKSELPPLEVSSFQSVCASGMMALKNAYLNVIAGERKAAISCASEFSSRWFRPGFYDPYLAASGDQQLDSDAEFLRWTLSDGAGALLVEPRPNQTGFSLRIDWIELRSYADRFPPCMYAGTSANDTEGTASWSSFASPIEAAQSGAIMLKQDFDLLHRMFPTWIGYYLELIESGKIDPAKIDRFLPHYSAHSLRNEMIRLLERTEAMIPEERWFNNIARVGNTGSASIYLMLNELFQQGSLSPDEKILCFVPESGQCTIAFMQLTVCEADQ